MEQILYAVDYEFHMPGMNFLGGGTKVTDRFSLNYEGKRGTKNYMIPTTKKDYVAMEHDLVYFIPDMTVKKFADWEFLSYKEYTNSIEDFAILNQYYLRDIIDLGKASISGAILYKQMKNLYQTLMAIPQIGKPIENIRLRELKKEILKRSGDMANNPRNAPAIARLYNSIDEEIKRQPKGTILNALYTTIFKFLPNAYFANFYVAPAVAKNMIEFYNTVKDKFIKSSEYKDVKKELYKINLFI